MARSRVSEPEAAKPLIEIEGVYKRYGRKPVLRGVDLRVAEGEVVALLGGNGAGKSTLVRIVAGLSRPDRGAVRLGGATVQQVGAALRRYIGVVAHQPLLYPNLTGRENLQFFARLYDVVDVDERAESLLRTVDLWPRRHDSVRTYSRGMVQRLAIARALLHNPPVLLLDEPDTGLDQASAAVLDELVQGLRASRRAILLTTHNLARAAAWSDAVCVLRNGRVAARTSTRGLGAEGLRNFYGVAVSNEMADEAAAPTNSRSLDAETGG